MELGTKRLKLREFRYSDISYIHCISCKKSFDFYSLDGTKKAANDLVQKAISLSNAPLRKSFKLAVEHKQYPGQCIGYVAFDDITIMNFMGDPNNGCVQTFSKSDDSRFTPDIGYFIDPEFQGQGLATEAMSALIRRVLTKDEGKGFLKTLITDSLLYGSLCVSEIWLTVHPENLASQGVARKLTFEPTGDHQEIETKNGREPRIVFKTNRSRFLEVYPHV